MSEPIQIGDKVEFDGRRGRIRGTVTDIKYSRPGSRNQLVRNYGLHTPSVKKFVVLPDGATPGEQGAGVWTVPEGMCRKVGSGDKEARTKANQIINHISQQRFSRASQGREEADAAGLYDLKKGDDIEVQFTDVGWQRRKFSHITHSGQVGFYREGDVRHDSDPTGLGLFGRRPEMKVRFTPAKFVRKAQAASVG
jgi:hypothetical protein